MEIYIEALKDIHNGLNHIMHSRSLTTFYLSGLQEVIEDSLLHNIENKLQQLKHRCSPKIFADAVCCYSNCLQHHISADIMPDNPVTFHSLCWRRLCEDSVDHQNDKEYLGEVCITEDHSGVTKVIKHYEAVGRPKVIAQADLPLGVTEKKEPHNPKANRTKSNSTKKLQKIIQRRQERVAEWHQKKEREALNTQSSKESCEDSVATPSAESGVIVRWTHQIKEKLMSLMLEM
ncbi:E3 ubiquitin-protein ligase TTC3-like isoform X2 [Dysidea avara]|uniref:E3 ubiquitin-protein ligase TTC3-like isoform X2 n=2 Tax=Dysidea avara TaxID=196820 RepID=UPI0033263AFE